METNLDRLDIFARAYFHKGAAREWLIIRMEMLSVIAFTIFLLILIAFPQGSMNPSTFLTNSSLLLTRAFSILGNIFADKIMAFMFLCKLIYDNRIGTD